MSTSTLGISLEQAIKDSQLSEADIASPETGVIFGHDSVAEPSYNATKTLLEENNTKNIGSGYIFQIMNSTVSMNLSTIFNTKGANWSLAGACASGSHAIGRRLI